MLHLVRPILVCTNITVIKVHQLLSELLSQFPSGTVNASFCAGKSSRKTQSSMVLWSTGVGVGGGAKRNILIMISIRDIINYKQVERVPVVTTKSQNL